MGNLKTLMREEPGLSSWTFIGFGVLDQRIPLGKRLCCQPGRSDLPGFPAWDWGQHGGFSTWEGSKQGCHSSHLPRCPQMANQLRPLEACPSELTPLGGPRCSCQSLFSCWHGRGPGLQPVGVSVPSVSKATSNQDVRVWKWL